MSIGFPSVGWGHYPSRISGSRFLELTEEPPEPQNTQPQLQNTQPQPCSEQECEMCASSSPIECAICLDLNPKKGGSDDPDAFKRTTIVNCNHAYHKECITTWYKVHQLCPMCRGTGNLVVHETKPKPQQIASDESTTPPNLETLRLDDLRPDPYTAPLPGGTSRVTSPLNAYLEEIREGILQARRAHQIDLSDLTEQAPETALARGVHSLAGRMFGWSS